MAKLSKLGKRYRLRYVVYFPGGQRVERSRLLSMAQEAKEKASIANEIEAYTANKTYTARQLETWRNMRLISRADRARLAEDLPGQGKTLETAMDEWESTWAVGPEEAQTRHFRRKKILKILGADTPIRALEYAYGQKLIQDLKALKLKVATIRKYVQDLKAAMNHQLAIRYLEYNPFATLSAGRIPSEEKINHVILTDKQIREVLDKAKAKDQKKRPLLEGTLTLHLLMFFGLGIRRKEAMATTWDMISWKERSIALPAEITKTGKARKIGLGARLYQELLSHRRKTTEGGRLSSVVRHPSSDFILPRFAPWSVSRAMKNHLEDCGIKARLHDARHTYTTMLQDLGVAPHRAMERTGHADMKMLSHYSHGNFDEVYEDEFGFMKEK